MLLIDQDAEVLLTKALEVIRMEPGLLRCLHLKIANTEYAHKEKQKALLDVIGESILTDNKRVFCCEDGDIFVIASGIAPREFITLKTLLTMQLHMEAVEQLVKLYELSMSANQLLLIIEKKHLQKKQQEDEARQHALKEQAERQREQILNRSIDEATARQIHAIRDNRTQPEIMVVEDDPFSCRLVENVLKQNFSLTIVQEGKQLVSQYVLKAPDVLFMDINLPDVNGHELVSKILSFDPHAYIIMLSGNSDRENVMQAVQRGAKGFVGKPFSREKLYQYIEKCPSLQGRLSHQL